MPRGHGAKWASGCADRWAGGARSRAGRALLEEENRAIGWVLGSLLGRLVAQKWDGTMLYDVRDTGKRLEYGVRRSVTNLELQFHTDAPWLALPPEHVGLLCLNRAPEGGVSRFVSLADAHDTLGRRAPGLLKRLFEGFPFDRQAEHAPDDPKVEWQPVFAERTDGLVCRYNRALIDTGAELGGEALDQEAVEALDAMRALVESPQRWVELTMERGSSSTSTTADSPTRARPSPTAPRRAQAPPHPAMEPRRGAPDLHG